MSQVNVERVIGLLVTDERVRRMYMADPPALLCSLVERGVELTPCELHALSVIDSRLLGRFADAIDPRLQRADLGGGGS